MSFLISTRARAAPDGGSEEARRRFDITLENAQKFLRSTKSLGNRFTPMGVIQGWSPDSMAVAAEKLQAMGYTYLALGGMAPLRSYSIHACLDAIREKIRPETRLHILGFAKADQIHEFVRHNITSFDTTSPLLRAFKDQKVKLFSSRAERQTALLLGNQNSAGNREQHVEAAGKIWTHQPGKAH